jgi:hypothetical protein
MTAARKKPIKETLEDILNNPLPSDPVEVGKLKGKLLGRIKNELDAAHLTGQIALMENDVDMAADAADNLEVAEATIVVYYKKFIESQVVAA